MKREFCSKSKSGPAERSRAAADVTASERLRVVAAASSDADRPLRCASAPSKKRATDGARPTGGRTASSPHATRGTEEYSRSTFYH